MENRVSRLVAPIPGPLAHHVHHAARLNGRQRGFYSILNLLIMTQNTHIDGGPSHEKANSRPSEVSQQNVVPEGQNDSPSRVDAVADQTRDAVQAKEELTLSAEAKAETRELSTTLKALGLTHQFIGVWIWVHGEQEAKKATLKELGFKWVKKRKAWGYCHPSAKKPPKEDPSFADMEDKYGSHWVTAEPQAA